MSRQLASILEKAGVLQPQEIASALAKAEQSKRPLWETILSEKMISEETLSKTLSQYLHLPYVKLAATTIDPEVARTISEQLARKYICLPLTKEEDKGDATPRRGKRRPTLVVAMADPTDLMAIQDMEFFTACSIKPVVSTRTEVQDGINHHFAPDDWMDEFLQNVGPVEDLKIVGLEGAEDIERVDSQAEGKKGPAVKMVNLLIRYGIKCKASDIHIEPTLHDVQVRVRVEGLLREYMRMPKWIQEPLVSRMKILAVLDITARRIPQDGRIKVAYSDREIDLRVSTLPTHFGEKVVLRILGSGQRVPSTASLGIKDSDLEILKKAADQPQGLILVTGPTGSGKTTTLYSILAEKKKPEINIITVEDPIEIQLAGINQVQVNTKAGLTFAASLRSILRQDPDVILVGEIRDLETAEIAFHAAMTGHLVLSTLHTNSTIATVARLFDLGVEPFMVGTSVNLIVAQRLVRRICEHCKEPYDPDPKQLERLHLSRAEFTYYHGKGCDACGKTGYSGRIGVYEFLRMTPRLKEMVNRKAPEEELRTAMALDGSKLLLDEALQKIREGLTTVEEVLRVIQLQEEEVTRCPKCGSLISRDFAHCPYCFFSLKAICESCRQELKPGWQICPYCGTALPAVVPPTREKPASAAALDSRNPAASASASSASISPPPVQDPTTLRRPHILVVDDDEVMRSLVASALELLPSKPEVIEAEDGLVALAKVEGLKPDLLILDVMMPGLSGFEVCERLRKDIRTAFIPILMLTANTDEQTRTKGFMVGTDDYMTKPISIPELHARVGRLLRRTYGM
jgi:type IV pilus assembly protein PilB